MSEPFFHLPQLEDKDRVWLNSMDVVDRILREFVRNMLNQFEERENFISWLSTETVQLNNLFLGLELSEVYSIGPWNAPDECGQYVLKVLQIDGDPKTAVRDAFMLLTRRILDLVAESDFDAVALDMEINRMMHVLLGTVGSALE